MLEKSSAARQAVCFASIGSGSNSIAFEYQQVPSEREKYSVVFTGFYTKARKQEAQRLKCQVSVQAD